MAVIAMPRRRDWKPYRGQRRGGRAVVIVGASPEDRAAIRAALEPLTPPLTRLIEAGSHQEALWSVPAEEVDLLITVEAEPDPAAAFGRVPHILVREEAEPERIQRWLDAGVSRFVVKRFLREGLADMLH